MKLKNLLCMGTLAAAAMASMSANAAVIGTIPGGSNDNAFVTAVFGAGAEIEGFYAGNIWATSAMTIDVTYFGAEAALTNNFSAGAGGFTHGGGNTITGSPVPNPVATTYSFNVAGPGLVPFSFLTGLGQLITNGANPGNTVNSVANFFATVTPATGATFGLDNVVNGFTPSAGTSVWLFLDDASNNLSDDNHDDMVIRLTARTGTLYVPEPATLSLLGLGLLGMGALRRRKLSA